MVVVGVEYEESETNEAGRVAVHEPYQQLIDAIGPRNGDNLVFEHLHCKSYDRGKNVT